VQLCAAECPAHRFSYRGHHAGIAGFFLITRCQNKNARCEANLDDARRCWARASQAMSKKSWESGSEARPAATGSALRQPRTLGGVAVYDRQGKVVAITSELAQVLKQMPQDVTRAMAEGHGEGSFTPRQATLQLHMFCAAPCTVRMKSWWPGCCARCRLHSRPKPSRVAGSLSDEVLVQVFIIAVINGADRAFQHCWADRSSCPVDARASHGQNFLPPANAGSWIYSAAGVGSSHAGRKSLSQARNAAENEARLREASESMWTADRWQCRSRPVWTGGRLFGSVKSRALHTPAERKRARGCGTA